MTKLAELQSEMQRAVLGKSAHPAPLISQPPTGSRQDRLAVYQSAYVLRLSEFLANDFEKLRTYLGDVRFREMAQAYVAAHPSDHPNARWYSRHLPGFLQSTPGFRRHPEIAELATLELALNDAFDGPDVPVCTMADAAAVDPARFGDTVFDIAPTVHRFAATTNVTSLWACLKCDEQPPEAHDIGKKSEIMVWRQASGSRFRLLGDEEAMAVDCARQGLAFGVICEMMAAFEEPESAALRAAGYLRGWIEAEIISCMRTAAEGAK